MRHLLATILPADFKAGQNKAFVSVLSALGYAPEKGFR